MVAKWGVNPYLYPIILGSAYSHILQHHKFTNGRNEEKLDVKHQNSTQASIKNADFGFFIRRYKLK